MVRRQFRQLRERPSDVLVAVREQDDALAAVFGGGIQLVFGLPERLGDVGGGGRAGIVEVVGVEGLAGRGLRVRVLGESNDANLVHRAHPFAGLLKVVGYRGLLILADAFGGVHQEKDGQRFAFLDESGSGQDEDQKGGEQAAQQQGQALSPGRHIGDAVPMLPPEEGQQGRQQEQGGPIRKLNGHVQASYLQNNLSCAGRTTEHENASPLSLRRRGAGGERSFHFRSAVAASARLPAAGTHAGRSVEKARRKGNRGSIVTYVMAAVNGYIFAVLGIGGGRRTQSKG